MGRRLSHAPARTRRTKAAPFIAEGEQNFLVAGITSQAQKAMGQDATLQVVVKLMLHISRQACGSGIGIEQDKKGFKMYRNYFTEDHTAWIP
jgi:hypothetical protein